MPGAANIGGGGGKKETAFGATFGAAVAGFVSGDSALFKARLDVDLDDRLLTGMILISSRLSISSFLLVVFVGVINASGSISSLFSSII